ncbi:MAG: hypothetical protein ABUK01_01935 [Leptospirales bacterium]
MYYHYKFFKNEDDHWPDFSDEKQLKPDQPTNTEKTKRIELDVASDNQTSNEATNSSAVSG